MHLKYSIEATKLNIIQHLYS